MSVEQQCFRCHAKGLPSWPWSNYALHVTTEAIKQLSQSQPA